MILTHQEPFPQQFNASSDKNFPNQIRNAYKDGILENGHIYRVITHHLPIDGSICLFLEFQLERIAHLGRGMRCYLILELGIPQQQTTRSKKQVVQQRKPRVKNTELT